MSTPPSIAPPQQARSRASQDRLLKAAKSLIEECGFEQASLREICRRAGLTSGAFYARFASKTDLAHHFLDDAGSQMEAMTDAFNSHLAEAGLEPAIRHLLSTVSHYYRTEGRVLRGLVALIRHDPEIGRVLRRINAQTFAKPIRQILQSGVAIHHPNPALALRLAFMCTFTSLLELVLNQHFAEDAYGYDDQTLIDELTRMFLNYLGA